MRREFCKGLAGIPEHLREPMTNYFEHGIMPGHFLQRCLQNELTAILHAGPATIMHIPAIVSFIFDYLPSDAWGSYRKVCAWRDQNGIRGIYR